jgi:hypothetical protein
VLILTHAFRIRTHTHNLLLPLHILACTTNTWNCLNKCINLKRTWGKPVSKFRVSNPLFIINISNRWISSYSSSVHFVEVFPSPSHLSSLRHSNTNCWVFSYWNKTLEKSSDHKSIPQYHCITFNPSLLELCIEIIITTFSFSKTSFKALYYFCFITIVMIFSHPPFSTLRSSFSI